MKPFERIGDHRLVTDWFGCWPSFHDGEVQRITLDRVGGSTPSLELDLRGWILIGSANGELVQSREALLSFRFEGISDLQLEGFNQQNVITALHISDTGDPGLLCVEFEHCYQFSCSFKAHSGRVMQLRPCQYS